MAIGDEWLFIMLASRPSWLSRVGNFYSHRFLI